MVRPAHSLLSMTKLEKQQFKTKCWAKGENVYWPDYNTEERKVLDEKRKELELRENQIKWSTNYYKELNKRHKYGYNQSRSPYSYRPTY